MSSEAGQRFHVEFAGECLEGHAPDSVREGLAGLFKADEAALERLFSGRRQRIKSDCDRATAARYQKAMAGVGARAIVTASKTTGSSPASGSDRAAAGGAAATTKAGEGSTEATHLDLAPPGSDVLRPEERDNVVPPALDLAHLSLAAAGADLSDRIEPPPGIDAPDFELAETGVRLEPEHDGDAPPPPDVSALDLAPEGQDFSDCVAPLPAGPPPSTEHLSLAESGGELLNADERRRDTAVAPDTSHLAIAPRPDDNPFQTSD